MAQRGNIYSSLYQSDSEEDQTDQKTDDAIQNTFEIQVGADVYAADLNFLEDLKIAGCLPSDDDNNDGYDYPYMSDADDIKIIPVTPHIAAVAHPVKPIERITHTVWRTEMIYQAIPWLCRDAIEMIATYAAHTETERFICVLEDISRRGFNNLLIDAGFKYFETKLKLEWLGGPELPYDCKQYILCVKCANSGRGLCIEGALEDVLPSKKHLFGLTRHAENKKENRKLRTAYRIKMAELFMRY